MLERKANFWEIAHEYNLLCCLTNWSTDRFGNLIMGGGLAKEFAEKFPHLPSVWGEFVLKNDPRLIFAPCGEYQELVSFPTKIEVWKDAKIDLIEKCAKELDEYCTRNNVNALIGRPGCGLGGLDWETQVKPIMSDCSNLITVIHWS